MATNYTQEIIHQFDLTKGIPLDKRLSLDKFVNFDTFIPKNKRYAGLITWVEDRKMFFICTDKTSVPKSIIEFLSSATVSSLNYTEPVVLKGRSARTFRSTIIDQLNATNPKSGNIVTIEPLKVTFIYDGTSWRYLSGIYNFPSINDYLIFPNELKIIGNKVLIGDDEYLITNDYTLTQKVSVVNKYVKSEFKYHNDCYYDIDGVLHYYFGNTLYKLGEKMLLKDNFQISKNTKISHDLKSSLITVLFRINNINSEINDLIIYPEIKYISDNEIEIQSKTDVKGQLILITNI